MSPPGRQPPGASFLRACILDVAVRKPGNVSVASAGHGMRAELFIASAEAAVEPLFGSGLRVGQRIEAAVAASWQAAGCNTNLGIVLLCAPIAMAFEQAPAGPTASSPTASSLRSALEAVLAGLDLADTEACFRAIVRASPGGLGTAADQDVRDAPGVGLRQAMSLAADRDSIARQYRDAYAELFDFGLPALGQGFSLPSPEAPLSADAVTTAAVQRLFLTLLSRQPDSHIVRNRGEAVAHIVMSAAQGWLTRAQAGESIDADPEFAAWDDSLKADRINPGTTADLSVATLLLAGLTQAL